MRLACRRPWWSIACGMFSLLSYRVAMATTNLQAELRPLPPATSSSLLLFAEPRGTGERSHSPANCNTNPLHTASAARRRSYVTHLTEDGIDRRFIQVQVGHECDSSTAIYTHVSDDFMNTMLRKALGPALDPSACAGKDR